MELQAGLAGRLIGRVCLSRQASPDLGVSQRAAGDLPRSEEARGWWCAVCVCLQGFVTVSREREGGTAVGVESRSRPASEPGLFFFLGVVSFVFFSGDLASLLQEFDWIGSSNRQQKIGSSPEKTKPLQVLATFRWNVLPSGLAFSSVCLAAQLAVAYQLIPPLSWSQQGRGQKQADRPDRKAGGRWELECNPNCLTYWGCN